MLSGNDFIDRRPPLSREIRANASTERTLSGWSTARLCPNLYSNCAACEDATSDALASAAEPPVSIRLRVETITALPYALVHVLHRCKVVVLEVAMDFLRALSLLET